MVARSNSDFMRSLPPLWDEYLHQDYVQKVVDICFEMMEDESLDRKESLNSTERQYTYARDEGGESAPQWSSVKRQELPKSVPVNVTKVLKPPNPPKQPQKMSPVKPKNIVNVPHRVPTPRTRISRFVGNPKQIDFKADHPDLKLIQSTESLFPCRTVHVHTEGPREGATKLVEPHETWHDVLTKQSALPVRYVQEPVVQTEAKPPTPTIQDTQEECPPERQRLIVRDCPTGPKLFTPLPKEKEMKNLKIVNLPGMYVPKPCSVQKVLQMSISGKKAPEIGNIQYSEWRHGSSTASNSPHEESPKEPPKAEYESDFESNYTSEKSVSSKSRKSNRFFVPFLDSGLTSGSNTEANSDQSSSENMMDERRSKSRRQVSKGSKNSDIEQNKKAKVRHKTDSNSAETPITFTTSSEIQSDSETSSQISKSSKSSKSSSHSRAGSASKISSLSRSVDEAEKSIDYGNMSSNTEEIFGLIKDCLSAGYLQKENLFNTTFDTSSLEVKNECQDKYVQTHEDDRENESCIYSMIQKICTDSPTSVRLHRKHYDEAEDGAKSKECLSLEKMIKEQLNLKEYESVLSSSDKQQEEADANYENRSVQTSDKLGEAQNRSVQTEQQPICVLQNRSVQTETNKELNITDSLSCYCKDSLPGKRDDYKDYTLFSTSWNSKVSKSCGKNPFRPKFMLEDETEDEMSSFSFDSNSKTAEMDKNSNIDSESPPSSLSLGSSYFSCLSPDGSLKLSYLSSSLSFSDLSSSWSDSNKDKDLPGT